MKNKLLIASLVCAVLLSGCGNVITENDKPTVDTSSQSVTETSAAQTTSAASSQDDWEVSLVQTQATAKTKTSQTAESSESEDSAIMPDAAPDSTDTSQTSASSDQTSESVSDTETSPLSSQTEAQVTSAPSSEETTAAAVTSPTQAVTTTTTYATTTTTTTTTSATTTTTALQTTTTTAAPRPVNTSDRTKPTVFYGGYTVYHLAGTAFDLSKYVSYGDDTDRNPRLTYTGSVNTSAVGSYPIKATVTDASGNSTSWSLTVNVVTKYPTYPTTTTPTKVMSFSEVVSKYKAANTRFGIDVSQWQGNVDYNAVKKAGCSFVFIRVGTKYGSYTLDPYFKTNLNNAIAAGLDVGVYLYTTDHTPEAARDSAKWIVSQLGGKKLTLPVAFDWEELLNFQKFGASINDINNSYIAFKNELAKSGYSSMIYGNLSTLNYLWSPSVKNSTPVWLACYRDTPEYSGNFGIWQVCCGRIPGIGGNTDFNVLYTDKRYK